MTAFTIIPGGWFDPFELVCSLRERLGQFGPAARGRRIMRINAADDHWPEMVNMLGRIERFGETMFQPIAEAARLYLEMLDPGAIVGWRSLNDEVAQQTMRFYQPLIGNPLTFWYGPGQVIAPAPGQLMACNTRIPHSAANFGGCPRIALVLDARPRSET